MMLRLAVVIGCLALIATPSAQSSRGSLAGTVGIAWNGMRVADAPIQIRHKETGAIVRTASSADGRSRSSSTIPAPLPARGR